MGHLKQRLFGWRFFRVFNWKEEFPRARSIVLLYTLVANITTALSTGIFYTSFLVINGMSLLNLGILSMISPIASLAVIFSPSILERFRKRKGIICAARIVHHSCLILGITLVPYLTQSTFYRTLWFVILTFVANIISSLFTPGLTAWHIGLIPDSVRADYFAYQGILGQITTIGSSLISSIIIDQLAGTPHEQTVLIVIRFIAYFFALLDVLFIALTPEYPYQHTHRPKFLDIFRLPLKNKPFMMTMFCSLIWGAFAGVAIGNIINSYLLNDCKIPYSYISGMGVLYPILMILLSGLWRKLIRNTSWLFVYILTCFLSAPLDLMYAFIGPGNYRVLYFVRVFLAYALSVGSSLTSQNLAFLYMPETDKTNYIAFSSIVTYIASLIASTAGTFYVSKMEFRVLHLFGTSFSCPQQLLLLQFVLKLIAAVSILLIIKLLMPKKDAEKLR